MGKKKSKEPVTMAGPDTVSSQSDIFKTIFGDITEPNAAASSLFSDDNPFKRKPEETVKNPEKVYSLDSDMVELKHRKRKEKEKAENLTLGSSEEAIETQKSKKGRNPENLNLGSLDSNVESSGLDAKGKKRKRDEVEKEYEDRKYGTVAVASDEEEEVVVGQKRKKPEDVGVVALVPKEGFDDDSKLMRTVFVGNLPIKAKKKVLLKEFSKFGEIESVRIRSVPLNDTKKPRKGAIMLKQINENADSVHAYIVFKTEQSAEASLANNMAVIAGNHIRVDRACPPRKKLKAENAPLYDNRRTVFVGNLPFDVKDEEIYQLFCGINNLESSIEAVRVIRDPQFGVGKGIAYVLFKTREAANVVVKKRTMKLRDRELRLSHAKSDATSSKRKNQSSSGTDSTPAKKLAIDSRTPSTTGNKSNTKASLSYQGLRASKSGFEKKVSSRGTIGPVKMKFKAHLVQENISLEHKKTVKNMGVQVEIEFPIIEFRPSDLKRGTDGWHRLCKRVREACETFGCFEVVYEKISAKAREETFGLMKELVEVPVERKQKNASPMPYHGWVGPCNQVSMLYEGFGLGDASNYDSVKSFAQLMWPDGHPHFCNTVHAMATQIEELNKLIWLMIIDSYGLGEKWESVMINYKSLVRFMKYMAPPPGDYERGLFAHTDKPVSTIICDDQVSGLEIEVNGQWIKLSLSPSSFCFVVGDPLKAWSNGRLKAVNHRVMMSGDKDRFSIATFAIPVEGTIIKAPKELIDEQHPQLYKDFDFMDFFLFAFSNPAKHIDSGEQLQAFASLSPPVSD